MRAETRAHKGRETKGKIYMYIGDTLPIIKRIINRGELQRLVNILYYSRYRRLWYIYVQYLLRPARLFSLRRIADYADFIYERG